MPTVTCAVAGRVEDMMKRSFAETDSTKHEIDRKQALADLQREISDIQGRESCPVCDVDIAQYYNSCASLSTLNIQMKVCATFFFQTIVTSLEILSQ